MSATDPPGPAGAGGADPAGAEAPALAVGVLGASGRMGSTVCEAVASDPALELVAAVDRAGAGRLCAGGGAVISERIEALAEGRAEVAVDFTVAGAALQSARWCAAAGVHLVIGTTGLGEDDLGELRELFGQGRANCVVAPNFAIGAALLVRLAELAAPHVDSIEIVELHHDAKADAPSGTALHSARRLARAREESGSGALAADGTRSESLAGARGGEGPGGIRVHSVRLRGLVAHQEVLMGAAGQSLTIRHDCYDRTAFMPGVLAAVRSVARRPGLTVGLEALLGW